MSTAPGGSVPGSRAGTSPSNGFPPAVTRALATLGAAAAGVVVPTRLPVSTGTMAGEASVLGGGTTVVLRQDTAGQVGRELASFTTVPASSPGAAAQALASLRHQTVVGCLGPSTPLRLGPVQAASCPTAEGPAITWSSEGWTVQVLTLAGSAAATAQARSLATWLVTDGLPAAPGGGLVSEVVPGGSAAGDSPTILLAWQRASALVEVRSLDDPEAAVAMASSAAPYAVPAG